MLQVGIDSYAVPKSMGIFQTITSTKPITTVSVATRIIDNHEAYKVHFLSQGFTLWIKIICVLVCLISSIFSTLHYCCILSVNRKGTWKRRQAKIDTTHKRNLSLEINGSKYCGTYFCTKTERGDGMPPYIFKIILQQRLQQLLGYRKVIVSYNWWPFIMGTSSRN